MPTIINQTEKSRVYQKGDRYFISQVQDGRLCRQVIAESEAAQLKPLHAGALDITVGIYLADARATGDSGYFEVRMEPIVNKNPLDMGCVSIVGATPVSGSETLLNLKVTKNRFSSKLENR